MSKKKILIIPVGGTISAHTPNAESPNYISGALGIDYLVDSLKESKAGIEFSIQPLVVEGATISVHSSSLTLGHLEVLFRSIQAAIDSCEYNGVIITHGTDTIEETAFFLQLKLRHEIPIVLVSSMRPADHPDADGPHHFKAAIRFILSENNINVGVVVVSNFQVFSAFDVYKEKSYSPLLRKKSEVLECPFVSPFFGPIAKIEKNGDWFLDWELIWNKSSRFFQYQKQIMKLKFSNSGVYETVPILSQYIGNDSVSLLNNYYLKKDPPPQIVVLEGNGNGSISSQMKKFIAADIAAKSLIFIRSSKLLTTWCVDDQLNYPGTLGSNILGPRHVRILALMILAESKNQVFERMKQVLDQEIPHPVID